jgi:hypothetical protein
MKVFLFGDDSLLSPPESAFTVVLCKEVLFEVLSISLLTAVMLPFSPRICFDLSPSRFPPFFFWLTHLMDYGFGL